MLCIKLSRVWLDSGVDGHKEAKQEKCGGTARRHEGCGGLSIRNRESEKESPNNEYSENFKIHALCFLVIKKHLKITLFLVRTVFL